MARKGIPVYVTTTLSPHTLLPTGEGTWACRGDSGTSKGWEEGRPSCRTGWKYTCLERTSSILRDVNICSLGKPHS